jgi:Family of unknown function (DUF5996)
MGSLVQDGRGEWPSLPFAEWKDTCQTLQLYMQVIGKVRLALAPLWNQWWNVPFYVTARGLTTSAIPYGHRTLEIRFDFLDHALSVDTSDGTRAELPLVPRSVAEFYRHVQEILGDLRLDVPIRPVPCELPNPIPFVEDTVHHAYDREAVQRFWTITRQLDAIFKRFRGRFRGKCSPVHFFWGSFDLCVTRFSGRMAPERPGADSITAVAYDEEVSSLGFWPGSDETRVPMVYSYTAPEPSGLAQARILPPPAFYSRELKEFLLPYDAIQNAADPDGAVLEFAESTYVAGATSAGWDVEGLRYQRADAEADPVSARL